MEKLDSRGKLLVNLALQKKNKSWGTYKVRNYISEIFNEIEQCIIFMNRFVLIFEINICDFLKDSG